LFKGQGNVNHPVYNRPFYRKGQGYIQVMENAKLQLTSTIISKPLSYLHF